MIKTLFSTEALHIYVQDVQEISFIRLIRNIFWHIYVVVVSAKGSRSHLQPALNILKIGTNEECTILMTYI